MLRRTEFRTVAEMCDALEEAGARCAALMSRMDDPAPIAVGAWTIGDTARHVVGSAGYFLGTARGEIAPERLDEVAAGNAADLAADSERDPRRLASRFERGHAALIGYARGVDGDPVVRPFADVEVPMSSLLGVELGEVLVHGFDMARAARLPWRIEPRHAVLVHQAYLPLLPHTLDARRAAQIRLRLEMRIRGMDRYVIVVENAKLYTEEPSRSPVDAHLSADPASYLLLVWQRIGPLRPMLRGQLIAWGRRPWRAMALQGLIST